MAVAVAQARAMTSARRSHSAGGGSGTRAWVSVDGGGDARDHVSAVDGGCDRATRPGGDGGAQVTPPGGGAWVGNQGDARTGPCAQETHPLHADTRSARQALTVPGWGCWTKRGELLRQAPALAAGCVSQLHGLPR